jgi:hypothetical protein
MRLSAAGEGDERVRAMRRAIDASRQPKTNAP